MKHIQVFGMMCSGTNYAESLMRENIKGVEVLGTDFNAEYSYGWKHADIGTKVCYYTNGVPKETKILNLDWNSSKDVLLVVVYRNIFDWIRSLHLNPYHAPELQSLLFEDFMSKKWRTYYEGANYGKYLNGSSRNLKALKRYIWEEFENVFHMRTTKIKIFESFGFRFKNVVYVNYESLQQNPEGFIEELCEKYEMSMRKKFRPIHTYKNKDSGVPYKKRDYEPLSRMHMSKIISAADWKLEEQIGYSRPRRFNQQVISPKLRYHNYRLLPT